MATTRLLTDVPIVSGIAGPWLSGSVIWPANFGGGTSSALGTGGVTAFVPFIVGRTTTLSAIGFYLATAQTGAAARLGIYQDTNGVPGALIVDAGEMDCSTGGGSYKELAASASLTPGLYWGCVMVKPSNPQITAVRMGATTGRFVVGAGSLMSGGGAPRYYTSATSYGAMPATAASVSASTGNDCPVLGLKAV